LIDADSSNEYLIELAPKLFTVLLDRHLSRELILTAFNGNKLLV